MQLSAVKQDRLSKDKMCCCGCTYNCSCESVSGEELREAGGSLK